jgi:hypothetical protein
MAEEVEEVEEVEAEELLKEEILKEEEQNKIFIKYIKWLALFHV